MSKFQQLLESYGMMTRSQRLFYPRNFNLSPEFINALKKELERQNKAGMDLALFERKLSKALQFFIADFKKMRGMKSAQQVTDQDALEVQKGLEIKRAREMQMAAEARNKKKTP